MIDFEQVNVCRVDFEQGKNGLPGRRTSTGVFIVEFEQHFTTFKCSEYFLKVYIF